MERLSGRCELTPKICYVPLHGYGFILARAVTKRITRWAVGIESDSKLANAVFSRLCGGALPTFDVQQQLERVPVEAGRRAR